MLVLSNGKKTFHKLKIVIRIPVTETTSGFLTDASGILHSYYGAVVSVLFFQTLKMISLCTRIFRRQV